MGFLGGGFFGSGSKSTKTSTTTTNQVDETGVQVSGDESLGVARVDGDIIYNKTDQGAFADAVDFAQDALEIPGAALDAVVDTSARAIDAITDAQDRSFDFTGDVFDNSLIFARDLVARSQDSIGDTVTALNTIAREQSKSTDERLAEIAKYVVIGVVVLGIGIAIASRSD